MHLLDFLLAIQSIHNKQSFYFSEFEPKVCEMEHFSQKWNNIK